MTLTLLIVVGAIAASSLAALELTRLSGLARIVASVVAIGVALAESNL